MNGNLYKTNHHFICTLQLIQMEARYGGDARFKLDTRFMDKENEGAGTGATAEVKESKKFLY